MDAGAEGPLFLQYRPAGRGIVLLRLRVALPHLSWPNLEALFAVQRVVFMVILKTHQINNRDSASRARSN